MIGRWLLPEGVDHVVLPLLVGKALRAFADGYVAVLLPAYLLALGFGTLDVGILSTATLLGSAFATLAVGAWGHRFHHRHLLLGAALLMLGTGLSFASLSAFWPLLLVAFVGIPASICLIVAAFVPSLEHAFALLLMRALLSQMDVPVRSAFVMEMVTPAERAAAASFTAVPRSLASAISPTIGGALFAAGWLAAPLVSCGVLKICYDLMLWKAFRQHNK